MDPRSAHAREPARPGHMTSVMRAMSVTRATGPRVLRIGVVQGGRVREERLIKGRTTVTVGGGEDATFLVSSAILPPAHALFERTGDGYTLDVLEGMTGRIATSEGVRELPRRGRVVLDDDARGKVVIGATTLLFQLVDAPAAQPRPQLPLAVKGGFASSNDWALTLIAAFSFLVHFGLVGAMYSDWSDPIVADRYDVAGLTDLLSKIPAVPVEVPESTAGMTTPTTPSKASEPAKTETAQRHSPSSPRTAPVDNGQAEREKVASLVAHAEAMRMQTLVAMEGGPAVGEALRRSNVPGVDLSRAAAENSGIAKGSSELDVGHGGTPVQASKTGGLAVLGGPTRTEGIGKDSGKASETSGPTGIAQVGSTSATVAVPNAERVIAGLRGRFRSCYQKGLLDDSTMSGKVTIRAKVGTNGEVVSADVASSSGLSPAVGRCIADVVKRATFDAPGPSGSTLQIPVTFVQSK